MNRIDRLTFPIPTRRSSILVTIRFGADKHSGSDHDVSTLASTLSEFCNITDHRALVISPGDSEPDWTVSAFLFRVIRRIQTQRALLVIYYAGFGHVDSNGEMRYLHGRQGFDWSVVSKLIRDMHIVTGGGGKQVDTLVILDSCFSRRARSSAESSGRKPESRCWATPPPPPPPALASVLAACAGEAVTGSSRRLISFTSRLRRVLSRFSRELDFVDVQTLYEYLCTDVHSSVPKPVTHVLSGSKPIILRLQHQRPGDVTPDVAKELSRVVFQVSIKGATAGQAVGWVKGLPREYGFGCDAVYQMGQSVNVVFSCPLSVWVIVMRIPGVRLVCRVKGEDLLTPELRQGVAVGS